MAETNIVQVPRQGACLIPLCDVPANLHVIQGCGEYYGNSYCTPEHYQQDVEDGWFDDGASSHTLIQVGALPRG